MHDEDLVPDFLKLPLLNRLQEASKKVRTHYKGGWSSLRPTKKKEKGHMSVEDRMDVANGFIGFFVDLLTKYRKFIIDHPRGFDGEAFVASKSPALRPFVRHLLQSQLFHMFIDDRVRKFVRISEDGDFEDKLAAHERKEKWVAHSRYALTLLVL